MRLDERTSKRIECFCSRRPLLALLSKDEQGRPVLWVKQVRNGSISTEVIITAGSIRVRCRECLRWHRFDLWPEKSRSFERRMEESETFRQ